MTDTPTGPMAELIERLEKSEKGSRELDAAIWWRVQHEAAERCFNNATAGLPKKYPADKPIPAGLGRTAVQFQAPRYTRSLDAALTLVPEGMYWVVGRGKTSPNELPFGAIISTPLPHSEEIGAAEHSASVALALTIAALKAKESTHDR